MGGQNSKSDEQNGPKSLFNADEIMKMKTLFQEVVENCDLGLLKHMQKHLKLLLPDDIIRRVFTSMVKLSKGNQAGFTFNGFSLFLSHIFKGTLSEKSTAVLSLSSDSNEISGSDLFQFVSHLVQSYTKSAEQSKHWASWRFTHQDGWLDSFSKYLLQELFNKDDASNSKIYQESDVEHWLEHSPLMLRILESVFRTAFPIEQESESSRQLTPLLPEVTHVDWKKAQTILDSSAVLLLNHSLPAPLRREWRPLYSNRQFGDSFSQLQTRMIKKGPTVIIIRDKNGHVFGGFASDDWDLRPQFVGSASCFLFSLSPEFNVYTTSGYNTNYMYLNHGVQTLPNGLGMGGQLDYFGLWIDQSFNCGHSKGGPLCTTYKSPQLSKLTEFQVDSIEVWAVGPEPVSKQQEEGESSILDKDPEAKAMLSLIGRAPVSEGLRETDPTADIPEEHQLPPL